MDRVHGQNKKQQTKRTETEQRFENISVYGAGREVGEEESRYARERKYEGLVDIRWTRIPSHLLRVSSALWQWLSLWQQIPSDKERVAACGQAVDALPFFYCSCLTSPSSPSLISPLFSSNRGSTFLPCSGANTLGDLGYATPD
ncbi:unnamed protein product [Arctogadus glacialis]